jgi:hypothetical protein
VIETIGLDIKVGDQIFPEIDSLDQLIFKTDSDLLIKNLEMMEPLHSID